MSPQGKILTGLILLNLQLLASLEACSALDLSKPCHLRSTETRKIDAELESVISSQQIQSALVYFCLPPDLGTRQTVSKASLYFKGLNVQSVLSAELSEQHRQTLSLKFVDNKIPSTLTTLTAKASFTAHLLKSELLPGKGSFMKISQKQALENLRSSKSLDFENRDFQSFLKTHGLFRGKNENKLLFARRVFDFIRLKYSYIWNLELDRRVSITCKIRSSDCAGLSYLFSAILRANKIPSRALIGRWAESGKRPEGSSEPGSCHVMSDFFIDQIGWIPVDVSTAIATQNADSFGKNNGDFVVIHTNPDLCLRDLSQQIHYLRSIPDLKVWLGPDAAQRVMKRKVIWSVSNSN